MLRSQRQNRVLASMESPVRIDAHSHRRRHSFFFLHAPPPWNAYSGVGTVAPFVRPMRRTNGRSVRISLIDRVKKKRKRIQGVEGEVSDAKGGKKRKVKLVTREVYIYIYI